MKRELNKSLIDQTNARACLLFGLQALHHLTTSSGLPIPMDHHAAEAVDGLPNHIARDDLLQVANLCVSELIT